MTMYAPRSPLVLSIQRPILLLLTILTCRSHRIETSIAEESAALYKSQGFGETAMPYMYISRRKKPHRRTPGVVPALTEVVSELPICGMSDSRAPVCHPDICFMQHLTFTFACFDMLRFGRH